GHFRFSLIASGHQRLEFLASGGAAIVTVVGAYIGVRLTGAQGGAAALLLGGLVNAAFAMFATSRVIGPVRLKTAVPVLSCIGAAVIGVIVTGVMDRTTGATVAVLFYGARAASQWNMARLRLAWQGRLD